MQTHKVLLVVVLAFIGLLGGCSSAGNGSGQTAGYIQVPDGPRIKVVFNGPPELKVQWEKLGVLDDPRLGFQIQIVGNLQNVSNVPVDFASIEYLFDERPAGTDMHSLFYFNGNELGPGEQWRIMRVFLPLEVDEQTKVLEVRINGFKKQ